MHSSKTNPHDAIKDFSMIWKHAPFRFGGKWFMAKVENGWTCFRTKKAAIKNNQGQELLSFNFIDE